MMDWQKFLDMLPEHMRGGMSRYMERGIPPGSFMTAILTNDFKEAFMRADAINKAHMVEWAEYVVNYMPADAHGSMQKVREWIERGGLVGKNNTESEKANGDEES